MVKVQHIESWNERTDTKTEVKAWLDGPMDITRIGAGRWLGMVRESEGRRHWEGVE